MPKSLVPPKPSRDEKTFDIASSLRKWRRLNGMKQEALASRLGVSQSAVSFWENGREKPSAGNIRKLKALMAHTARDELAIERLFIKRQMGIRVLCDFDGIELLESSAGFKSLWPETADLENRSVADHLVEEARNFLLDADHARSIRNGEIGLASGVSDRITDFELDSAVKCQWHLCFRQYGYRTLLDVVFEPCGRDVETGITDIQYLG